MPVTTIAKSDPLVANHFFLEIDGEVIAQLSEVSGLDVELEVTDIQQQVASGMYEQRKAFSKPKWTGEISVKRLAPVDATQDALWKWFNAIREKGMKISSLDEQRKNGSVVIYDSTLAETARWNFYNAWPSKISNDSFTVGGNDPISETVTLQHEKLERTK
ncbi:MAG TPA: phage tail protein [Acidimicrobiales bacterium]|nr:phage tail protein [Acidimicrobiales bacterium]